MGNSTSSAQFSGSNNNSVTNSVALQQDNSDFGEPMASVVCDVDITTIKQHLQSGKPSKEFMYLENEDLDESDETIEAQKLYNREKNRYTNILPCDSTRVKLKAVEGVEGSDYINANFIDGELNGTQRAYIATQGPLMHTRCDFWRMVWENGCTTIVMLGKERENDRVKVDRYWPESAPDGELTFGTLIVRALGKEDDVGRGITVRKLELSNTAKKESRNITHYQYEGWPDHGVPTSAKPIRHLIRLIEKERNPLGLSTSTVINANANNNNNNNNSSGNTNDNHGNTNIIDSNNGSYNSSFGSSGSCSDDDSSSSSSNGSGNGSTHGSYTERMTSPVVVHCSAGVGRTGTFCTIHMTLARLHKEVRKGGNNARFNLYNTVLKLRRQRPGMVQQQEQYVFCYEAVAEEAEELGLLPRDDRKNANNNPNSINISGHNILASSNPAIFNPNSPNILNNSTNILNSSTILSSSTILNSSTTILNSSSNNFNNSNNYNSSNNYYSNLDFFERPLNEST